VGGRLTPKTRPRLESGEIGADALQSLPSCRNSYADQAGTRHAGD